MVAIFSVFGVAWMSETFFQAHMPLLKETLAHVVQAQPWTYALVLFLISKLVNSQAAALTAIAPWGWRWGRTQAADRLPAGELRLLRAADLPSDPPASASTAPAPPASASSSSTTASSFPASSGW